MKGLRIGYDTLGQFIKIPRQIRPAQMPGGRHAGDIIQGLHGGGVPSLLAGG
jgi:hypothetical protein